MYRLQKVIDSILSPSRLWGGTKQGTHRASASRRRASRLMPIEPLERRELLSVTVGFDGPDAGTTSDSVIYLNADQAAQTISLVAEGGTSSDKIAGAALNVFVDLGGDTDSIDITGINANTNNTIFYGKGVSQDIEIDADGNFAQDNVGVTTDVIPSGVLATLTLDTTGLNATNGYYGTNKGITLHLNDINDTGMDTDLSLASGQTWSGTLKTVSVYINNQPKASDTGLTGIENGGTTQTVSEGNTLALTSSITDADSDALSYKWESSSDGTNWQAVSGQTGATLNFDAAGIDGPATRYFRVTATDVHGYSSAVSETVTVNITDAAPAVTLDAITSIDEGSVASISGTVTDAFAGDVPGTVSVNWGDGSDVSAVTITNGAYTASHLYADAGTYAVTVSATSDDTTGAETGTAAQNVAVANIAPSNLNVSLTEGHLNAPIVLSGSFTNLAATDTHTVTIDWGDGTAPVAVALATGQTTFPSSAEFSHTYTTAGDYSVVVTVADDDGSPALSETIALTVSGAAPVVTIEDAPANVTEGQAVALTSTMTDEDGIPGTTTYTYVWHVTKDGVAYGTNGNSDSYTFTPDDNGVYVVTLSVTDSDSLTGVAEQTITVGDVAPTMDTTLNAAAIDENGTTVLSGTLYDPSTVDTAAGYGLEIAWGDGTQTFTLGNTTLTSATDGIDWDPSTGVFSVEHQYLDNPSTGTTYTINATATNKDASIVSAQVITVSNVAAVVSNLPSGNALEVEEDATYTVSGVTYTDVGTLDTHTATINWGDGSAASVLTITTKGQLPTASHVFADDGTYTVTITVTDKDGAATVKSFNVEVLGTRIVGESFVYNNSYYDTATIQNPTYSDAAAVATNKSGLTVGSGSIASFENYSSYSLGVNAIAIDIMHLDLTHLPTASDFIFRRGNDVISSSTTSADYMEPNLSTWTTVSPANVTVYRGAGENGSDRVVIAFADNLVQKSWLQVTVLATVNTGLEASEVFYLGNAIGETGNNTKNAQVTITDGTTTRANTATVGVDTVSITNIYDFNRNGSVDTTDEGVARSATTTSSTMLKLIRPQDTLVTLSASGAQSIVGSDAYYDFTVTLSSALTSDLTISVGTTGTAVAGEDYEAPVTTYTIPAGTTVLTIPVKLTSTGASLTTAKTLGLTMSVSATGVRANNDSAAGTIGGNVAPVAGTYTATSTTEDATRTGTINTATDANGDALAFTAGTFTTANGASVTITSTGSFTYSASSSVALQSLATGETVYDTFSYTVSDGKGGVTSGLAIVPVTGVNESTVAEVFFKSSGGKSIKVAECGAGTIIGTLGTAKDINATYTYSITGGTDAAKFTISGNTLVVASGATLDYETKTSYGVWVKSTRSDGVSKTQVLTVYVSNANDAPVNTLPSSLTATEGQSQAITGLSIADTDDAGGNMQVALSVQHGTLTVSGGMATIVGSGGSAVTLTGTKVQINATLAATVTYRSESETQGSDTLTMVTSDLGNTGSGGAKTDTDTIAITVTAVNDNSPVISSGASASVAENTTAVLTVTATDADLPAETLTYSIAGGDDADAFNIDASTGVLTFKSAPNYETKSAYNVTVQVSDGTNSVTQAIAIAVTNVNEAPTATGLTVSGAGFATVGSSLVYTFHSAETFGFADQDVGDTFAGATITSTTGITEGHLFIDGGDGVWDAGDVEVTTSTTSADVYAALVAGHLKYQQADGGATTDQAFSLKVWDSALESLDSDPIEVLFDLG